MAETKISRQRELFNLAFDRLGGLDKLVTWATETNNKGESNYGEFIKIFAKLVPPVKPDKGNTDTHESFIRMMIEEKHKLDSSKGQPIKLIEAEGHEIES